MNQPENAFDRTSVMVDFRATGDDFHPDIFTKRLMLSPTSQWEKGSMQRSKRPTTYACWAISTGYIPSLDIHNQLITIVDMLNDKVPTLIDLQRSHNAYYRIDVVIRIEQGQTPAAYIAPRIIAFANSLGATIDIDIYVCS